MRETERERERGGGGGGRGNGRVRILWTVKRERGVCLLPACVLLLQVSVFRVDDVQGKEFRALLLSTVRTCYARDDEDLEEDAGFLTNPKVSGCQPREAERGKVIHTHTHTLSCLTRQ